MVATTAATRTATVALPLPVFLMSRNWTGRKSAPGWMEKMVPAGDELDPPIPWRDGPTASEGSPATMRLTATRRGALAPCYDAGPTVTVTAPL